MRTSNGDYWLFPLNHVNVFVKDSISGRFFIEIYSLVFCFLSVLSWVQFPLWGHLGKFWAMSARLFLSSRISCRFSSRLCSCFSWLCAAPWSSWIFPVSAGLSTAALRTRRRAAVTFKVWSKFCSATFSSVHVKGKKYEIIDLLKGIYLKIINNN